jgi:hypothetical protein
MHNIFRLLSVLTVLLIVCEATQSALASTITIGETTVLSATDRGNRNLLAAQNATLSQAATIESLSFYVTQARGNLVLGIYDASGPNGGPGALKAQTNSFTPVVGWNTANVITPVPLAAGSYWLAYLASSNNLAFMKGQTSSVSSRYYSHPFGPLPATFSTSPSSDPYHWSFYATLNPVPTISSVSLSNRTFTAGVPSGTVVGAINVAMSSGSFTGSLSLSGANPSSFKIVGSNLETNGVLPAQSYSINIVATESGASNSPLTQAETLTAVSQSISSASLSNNSFIGGSPSGTVVGTINVPMSPSSPAFSGSLSLSTTQGGCTAANGANNSSFATSGNNLVTNGIVAPGSYAVCILAAQASASNSPVGYPNMLTGGSTTVTLGESNVLSTADSGNGNILAAQNATLSQPATINSLSFYVTQTSGNLVLGIYDANGPNGGPGALQAQTNSFPPVTGWNTANVITPVSLPAGTYWLAYLPSSSNLAFVKGLTSGISSRYYSYQFGALPAQFSTSPSSDPYHWSFDATLNSGTVSQSISSISLSKSSFVGGSPSGTVVATIIVEMTPSSPAFSGSLSLSTTQGGCTAANGANNSSFAISGNNLITNGVLAPGTYAVCFLATEASTSNTPVGQAVTITGTSSSATASLSANPTTILNASSSLLTWTSTNTTSCTGSNFSTGNAVSGSASVSPPATTTYSVSCTGSGGTASAAATVTVTGTQSIQTISLSDNSTTTGLSSGSAVGTFGVTLTPISPTFSYTGTNLHLSTTGTDSGGVCNSTNGAANGSFQIINGDTLATNGTLTSGSNSICVAASQAGVAAKGQTFTISVTNRIDASTFCGANGGGNGSIGSPWQAACIQAAVNAARSGDTIFLAAGHWALNTANAPVNVGSKTIHFVGAGSGNTFDSFGHISNPNGNQPTGTFTRVFSTGPSATSVGGQCTTPGATGGYISFTNPGTGNSFEHIFIDGSGATAGGSQCGIVTLHVVTNTYANDVRHLACSNPSLCGPFYTEPQWAPVLTSGDKTINSLWAEPANSISGGQYGSGQVFQIVNGNVPSDQTIIKNNIFYQFVPNVIDYDNILITGNEILLFNDGQGGGSDLQYGPTGCNAWGNPDTTCPANGLNIGNFHVTHTNNYWYQPDGLMAIGGGVNDPSTSGAINDLNYSGNWIIGSTAGIDSCEWHRRNDEGNCIAPNPVGMQINSMGGGGGNCTINPSQYCFNVFNNSIIGSSLAYLTASGNGLIESVSSHDTTTNNFNAHQNYLNGPGPSGVTLTTDANTINPSITGNYCVGGTFTQTDATQCATTGFTTTPTASFTLGPLSGSIVPFATTNFTAQYGAVQWYASTSSTCPASASTSWSSNSASQPVLVNNTYTPPASLSGVTHGSTVYLCVMDSGGHVSAPASAVVP